MSLPPPGQVYSPPNPDAFVHLASLNHITPLEAIGLLSQSSERCFIQLFPLVPAAFNLFTNSQAGTHSSPSWLGWDASLSHSCSGVTSALKSDLCIGKNSSEILSHAWGKPPGVIWGLFCFTARKMLSFLKGFPGFPDIST